MRRLLPSLVVVVLLVLAAPPVPAATGPDVSLRLLELAPWLTPTATDLRLRVAATNSGTAPVGNLSFGITVFTPSRSRNQYHASLRTDPPDDFFARFDVGLGTLAPGQRRILKLSPGIVQDVAEDLVRQSETDIYPMKVELRSGDTTVATLRAPILFLHFPKDQRYPTARLRMSWVFSLDRPVAQGPNGAFHGTRLQSDIAPGGSLAGEAAALQSLATHRHPAPVDIVWSPTLISQLQAMAKGYSVLTNGRTVHVPAGQGGAADADALLDTLHRLANGPRVESIALPYSSPSIPALLASGLGADLPIQLQRGRQAVSAFIGHPTSDDMFWPPGQYLDQLSLVSLASAGTRTFLLDPRSVRRPPRPKEFAQYATATLQSGLTAQTNVTAVVPDTGVTHLLESDIPQQDPRLAVQDVLGELAQIWLEEPGVPRAVALAVPDTLSLPGRVFGHLGRILSQAPFLEPKRASSIVRSLRPADEGLADLRPREGPRFHDGYLHAIEETRVDISLFRSILVGESPIPAQMESAVLLSEGVGFAADPRSGLAFLDDIRDRLGALFQGIAPDTSGTVTLASGRGVVPIGIVNRTPTPVRVRIRLASPRLNPESETEPVTLAGRATTPLLFRVRSRTTGRFPVQVRVLTPDGRSLGPPHELVVRSTAYNLVALILVLGAALFLLVWWARRFIPRAKPA
jgi:hypothetical protein